jgi:hypothetical protein
LWRNEFVCDEVDLFVAKPTYPRRYQLIRRQNHLIQARTSLSTTKQAYLRQAELIHGEASLSTANQPYLAQSKLICGKINSSRRKQGDFATNGTGLRMVQETPHESQELVEKAVPQPGNLLFVITGGLVQLSVGSG